MDSVHKRMGELRTNPCQRPMCGNVWVRNHDQGLNVDQNVVGSSFHEYLYSVDVGADKAWPSNCYGQWLTGAFIGYGQVNQTTFAFPNDGTSKSTYGGVYATWINPQGWYLDAVARAQEFRNNFSATSVQGTINTGSYNNSGFGASAELGKRFNLVHGWYIEPQAQAAYTQFTSASYTTTDGVAVTIDDTKVFQTRAAITTGFVVGCPDKYVEPYVRVGAFNQTTRGGTLEAESMSFQPNLDGSGIAGGAGLVYQPNRNLQLHVDYEAANNNSAYTMPWNVNVGLRWLM